MKTIKKSSLWQRMKARVVSKNINEGLDKSSALRNPLKLGEFVIHTPSGLKGIIRAIEEVNGQETVTFEDQATGFVVRRVHRQECRLNNSQRRAAF